MTAKTSFQRWLTGHPALKRRYRVLRGMPAEVPAPPPPPPPPPPRRAFPLTVPTRDGDLREVHVDVLARYYVGKVLEATGLAAYEPESTACFLALADVAGPGPIWDVGANIGVYTFVAAVATDRDIVAFEPTPDIADAMRDVLRDNGFVAEIRETALADAAGTATLFLSDRTDSSNSLREGFREASRTVDVPLETIDDLVAAGHAAPAVLKIDTETTEPAVLRGALATIASTRPWIMCEILPGRTEAELTEVLAPLGYTWYLITPETPFTAVDVLEGDPEHYMWLFAPEPAPERLWERIGHWHGLLVECGPAIVDEPETVESVESVEPEAPADHDDAVEAG